MYYVGANACRFGYHLKIDPLNVVDSCCGFSSLLFVLIISCYILCTSGLGWAEAWEVPKSCCMSIYLRLLVETVGYFGGLFCHVIWWAKVGAPVSWECYWHPVLAGGRAQGCGNWSYIVQKAPQFSLVVLFSVWWGFHFFILVDCYWFGVRSELTPQLISGNLESLEKFSVVMRMMLFWCIDKSLYPWQFSYISG